MPEIKEKKLFNQPKILKSEDSERESLEELEKETIFYKEFKEISERALDQYQKDHKSVDLNNFQEAIERIINSFPTEETQSLCRETFTSSDLEERISLLRKIDEETFGILKKKIDQWEKIFTNEEFKKKRKKDFPTADPDMPRHLWITPLQSIKNIIEIAEEERNE